MFQNNSLGRTFQKGWEVYEGYFQLAAPLALKLCFDRKHFVWASLLIRSDPLGINFMSSKCFSLKQDKKLQIQREDLTIIRHNEHEVLIHESP